MRRILTLLCFCLSLLSLDLYAQTERDTIPALLKAPVDWGFEKIPFPIGFAPDIPFEGYEELRFAPNWRDQSSPNYFTYAFAIHVTNQKKINKGDLQEMLEMYYRGLSKAVAEGGENQLNFSKIYATVAQTASKEKNRKNYQATVLFLDTFNKGEPVIFNMDIMVKRDKTTHSNYIITLVSPKEREDPIWQKLYALRGKVQLPVKD